MASDARASRRVVSLLPSATEMVCAVGARERLVGVSHECDWPAGVESLPVLTRPRKTLPKSSGAIDRAVREMLADALAVYEVDLERLRGVAPDVVVTQDLCDVCAVALDDVREALRELAREDVEVVSLKPLRLADVWGDVRRVGTALGERERGEQVACSLEQRCADIARRARNGARPDVQTPSVLTPSVLTIEWLDPVMIGGTWMPELVELAGGKALVTEPGQHAPTLTREQLAELEPDLVLIKPCGFDLERTAAELELLERNLPWDSWKAVREGRVFAADGNAYFNRPGPRLVESLEILALCLQPRMFADFTERHVDSVRRVTRKLELAAVSSSPS